MEKETHNYDFIIAGMGAAGLSLAMQLINSKVSFTKVLLIDQALKNTNDRTWCFWTKEKSPWYNETILKKWDHFEFKSHSFSKRFELKPYSYQMIRGIDFYNYCLDKIKTDSRFEIKTESITELFSEEHVGKLKTAINTYSAKHIFNSAFRKNLIKKNDINFVQHFKGCLIETEEDTFDVDCPVFMDFRTDQDNDCRFFYILPYSKKKALIEYTGFSPKTLNQNEYDLKLTHYIKNQLGIKSYKIEETEYGEIPMMESEFINPFGNKVTNIGTAGGNSKPSTGYTFYFIQKTIQNIVKALEQNVPIKQASNSFKFKLYDKVLLDVIDKKRQAADTIFTDLFQKNKVTSLLTFLNEETTLMEELFILNSVNKKAFITSTTKKMLGL